MKECSFNCLPIWEIYRPTVTTVSTVVLHTLELQNGAWYGSGAYMLISLSSCLDLKIRFKSNITQLATEERSRAALVEKELVCLKGAELFSYIL